MRHAGLRGEGHARKGGKNRGPGCEAKRYCFLGGQERRPSGAASPREGLARAESEAATAMKGAFIDPSENFAPGRRSRSYDLGSVMI